MGDKLEVIIPIRAVWDWGPILRPLRPKRADTNIQIQFSLVLEVRDSGTVFVKSKKSVSAKVNWGPWHQMLPHPLANSDELPTLERAPTAAAPTTWKKFDKVSRDLTPDLSVTNPTP